MTSPRAAGPARATSGRARRVAVSSHRASPLSSAAARLARIRPAAPLTTSSAAAASVAEPRIPKPASSRCSSLRTAPGLHRSDADSGGAVEQGPPPSEGSARRSATCGAGPREHAKVVQRPSPRAAWASAQAMPASPSYTAGLPVRCTISRCPAGSSTVAESQVHLEPSTIAVSARAFAISSTAKDNGVCETATAVTATESSASRRPRTAGPGGVPADRKRSATASRSASAFRVRGAEQALCDQPTAVLSEAQVGSGIVGDRDAAPHPQRQRRDGVAEHTGKVGGGAVDHVGEAVECAAGHEQHGGVCPVVGSRDEGALQHPRRVQVQEVRREPVYEQRYLGRPDAPVDAGAAHPRGRRGASLRGGCTTSRRLRGPAGPVRARSLRPPGRRRGG